MRRTMIRLGLAYAGVVLIWWSAGHLNELFWPRRQLVPVMDVWVWAWRPLWAVAGLLVAWGAVRAARSRRPRKSPGKADPAQHIAALQAGVPAYPTQQDDRTPLVLEGLTESYKVDDDGTISWHHKLEPPVIVDDLATGRGRARYIARLDYDVPGDRFEIGKWQGLENWISVVIRPKPPPLVEQPADLMAAIDWRSPLCLGQNKATREPATARTVNPNGRSSNGLIIMIGKNGSGKTVGGQIIASHWLSDTTSDVLVADGKGDDDWDPIAHRCSLLLKALDPDFAAGFMTTLDDIHADMERRFKLPYNERTGKLVILDETVNILDALDDEDPSGKMRKKAIRKLRQITTKCRSANIVVMMLTQHPNADLLPTSIREQAGVRVCFHVAHPRVAEPMLGYVPDVADIPAEHEKGHALTLIDGKPVKVMFDRMAEGQWAQYAASLPARVQDKPRERRYT